jgi:hypothetical protein
VLQVITPVIASRRAERFAHLLDEAAGTRRHHIRSSADSDLTELVTMTQRVSTLPLVVEVDPEFRAGLRASLMARIEREGIGATAVELEPELTRRRWLPSLLPQSSRARGAIVATVAAGAFAAFGVSAASGDAIPGETLYGVKRSTERAQLVLAGSDVSRGELYLEFAKTRLGEAGAVGPDVGRLTPVLDDMDAGTRDGSRLLTTSAIQRGDSAGLKAVQQFVGQQRPTMLNLVNRLNGPAKARAARSLALLDKVGLRSIGLESTVKCAGIDVPVDELGAVPVFCAHAAPPQQANVQGGQATEVTPQPTAAPTSGPAAEPVGGAPSVEAGSSASPSTSTNGSGESKGNVIESIQSVLDKVFG